MILKKEGRKHNAPSAQRMKVHGIYHADQIYDGYGTMIGDSFVKMISVPYRLFQD